MTSLHTKNFRKNSDILLFWTSYNPTLGYLAYAMSWYSMRGLMEYTGRRDVSRWTLSWTPPPQIYTKLACTGRVSVAVNVDTKFFFGNCYLPRYSNFKTSLYSDQRRSSVYSIEDMRDVTLVWCIMGCQCWSLGTITWLLVIVLCSIPTIWTTKSHFNYSHFASLYSYL